MAKRNAKQLKALRRAIDVVGSQGALAEMVSALDDAPVGQTGIARWVKLGRVPADRVLAVEKATGGSVSRHDLRPDIYPREQSAA